MEIGNDFVQVANAVTNMLERKLEDGNWKGIRRYFKRKIDFTSVRPDITTEILIKAAEAGENDCLKTILSKAKPGWIYPGAPVNHDRVPEAITQALNNGNLEGAHLINSWFEKRRASAISIEKEQEIRDGVNRAITEAEIVDPSP